MATTTISTFSSELLPQQAKAFWSGVEEDVSILQRIKAKNAEGVKGSPNYYVEGTVVNKLGYGWRPVTSEGAATPAAYANGAILTRFNCSKRFLKVKFSADANDEGALFSALDIKSVDMKAAMESVAYGSTIDLIGTSDMHLCKITALISTTGFYVDDPGRLRENMYIDSYTALTGGSQGINSQKITAVNYDTGEVTCTNTSGTVGDYVFPEDSRGYGIDGLGALLAGQANLTCAGSGYMVIPLLDTYGNNARSTTQRWTSFSKAHADGAFDPGEWLNFCSKAKKHRHGMGKLPWTAIYASDDAVAALLASVEYDKMMLGTSKVEFVADEVYVKSPLTNRLRVEGFDSFKGHSLWCIDENDLSIKWPYEPKWVSNGGVTLQYNGLESSAGGEGYDTYTAAHATRWTLIGHPMNHAILYGFRHIGE